MRIERPAAARTQKAATARTPAAAPSSGPRVRSRQQRQHAADRGAEEHRLAQDLAEAARQRGRDVLEARDAPEVLAPSSVCRSASARGCR